MDPKQEGILIAGGDAWYDGYDGDGSLKTEVFIPETGKTCSLPGLPDMRKGHSMDTLGSTQVICGGGSFDAGTPSTCLQLTPTSDGVWTNYTTLMGNRYGHSSWVSSAGLVLMGADSSDDISTEIVIVPSGGGNFSLVQNAW